MSEPLLRLAGVHTHIGRYHILHGVDLSVPEGGVTMLLGRNGAGKTTTLRTIIGHWRASQGSVRFAGEDMTACPTPRRARAGIAEVPESMGIFTDLTVEENMALAARAGKPEGPRLDAVFKAFPPLRTFWKNPAGNLSGGQKQMLSVARAMIEPRRLILIDEPSKGLAPAIVRSLVEALRALKDTGATILMVEQNFSVARALGDTVAVMDEGRVIHAGPMAELAENREMQERLMGLSLEAH
ncbi:MAG: ABC transporter ATP-binding protein [Rhodobacteraceae bacterium]|nr:ABC transporter ATP-binding protein [Paracoccaceae bacterium]MBR26873.1 ABC transporter ATP-binding protein [Paracoccaceae bacterium]MBR28787.1 ABC transporter ATP-binding protein [Paracoccaceae bacterium]